MSGTFAWTDFPDALDRARVVQCALSRVCGSCGASLSRPVAFVGTAAQAQAHSFVAPGMHESCARALAETVPQWQVVLTSGYEFVRPTRDDADRRPRFVLNSPIP